MLLTGVGHLGCCDLDCHEDPRESVENYCHLNDAAKVGYLAAIVVPSTESTQHQDWQRYAHRPGLDTSEESHLECPSALLWT
jgi:hypothetical protein